MTPHLDNMHPHHYSPRPRPKQSEIAPFPSKNLSPQFIPFPVTSDCAHPLQNLILASSQTVGLLVGAPRFAQQPKTCLQPPAFSAPADIRLAHSQPADRALMWRLIVAGQRRKTRSVYNMIVTTQACPGVASRSCGRNTLRR